MSDWERILSPGQQVAYLFFKAGGRVENVQVLECCEKHDFLAYVDIDVTSESQIVVTRLSELSTVRMWTDRPNPWLSTDYVARLKEAYGEDFNDEA